MGNAASALPFLVGEEVQGYPESSEWYWRLHKGKKRNGGDPVSIFRLTMKMSPHFATDGGRHGFQKLRTLRHPHILACLDSAELDSEMVLATEEVIPLKEWVSDHCEAGKKDDQVAWGLHCLCSALKFLHEDCKVSHNNISTDTVFVTSGGDWKLGGMDLLAPLDGTVPDLRERGGLQPRAFRAPERNHDDWWRSNGPIHGMDVYALGRLLEKVYPEGTPSALDKYVTKMLLPDPTKRPTPSQYLRCAFVRRQTVKDLVTLELFSVKTAEEKADVLKRFTVETHSKEALLHKVVPLLLREISVAVTSVPGAPNGQAAVRTAVSQCLPPLLELSKVMDDEMFHSTLQPALANLFAVNDRGVRIMLLSNIPSYGKRLEDKAVNDQVFEPLCAGFTDAAPALRELTLKSMVAFTSRLSEKNMNERLIKHLARLQGDTEDSIRTNAIIFLGKVAAQLKPAVRDKVLLPAFARGVKDPFVATRLAGLRATAACHQHFQAEEVCTKVLPSVMPCLIDRGSVAVREAAFACVETYMIKLKEVSERMQVEEEERKRAEAAERAAELAARGANTAVGSGGIAGGGAPGGVGMVGSGGAGGDAASAGGMAKKSSTGSEWGSWALSKLTETLASSAVPNGPVGDASPSSSSPKPGGAAKSSSSTSATSMPRHLSSPIAWNGTGPVSASIPGSVAAAVAAGVPIGGGSGGGLGNGDALFPARSNALGRDAADDVGGEEMWQDARETLSNTGTDDLSGGSGAVANGTAFGSSGSRPVRSSLSVASVGIGLGDVGTDSKSGAGGGWDWEGLDGIGEDDPPAPTTTSTGPTAPSGVGGLRVASLGAGKGGGSTAGRAAGSEEAARRREEIQRRREARRAQREMKPKPLPSAPKAKKLVGAAPPEGWEDI